MGAWSLGVRAPRAFFVFRSIRGHGNWTGDGGRRERWEFGNLRFEISDLRCATKERRGAREFYPQISQISTDGKRGVLRNLKQAGTVVLLRTICANLCNLWITHPRSAATT